MEAGDREAVRRLAEYIGRSPFSLARIISLNRDGKVIYRAGKRDALPYPVQDNVLFNAGMPRNFQVFDPLDFLAEVTQHIPHKGEHQIRYYGWYSNKKRGMRAKAAGEQKAQKPPGKRQLTTWAALIKLVYEVDPLTCPKCGGTMKIIGFIDQDDVIERILRHRGLWRKNPPRPPPVKPPHAIEDAVDYLPDYTVFDDLRYAE